MNNEVFYTISKIIKRDSETTTYKFALLSGVIDIIQDNSHYIKFPVNDGHALIISKNPCSAFFDLTFKEQAACMFMLNKVKEIVSNSFKPDGFNVGINIGIKAVQKMDQVYIHLIPSYEGDVDKPRGSVRGAIPSKQKY